MDTDFDKHPNRYRFTKDDRPTYQIRVNKKRISKKEKQICYKVLTGTDPVDAYADVYGVSNDIDIKSLILFRQERIKRFMSENLKDVAKKLGLDHERILQDSMDLKDATKDDRLKFEIIKKLGEVTGTYGEKTRTTTTGAVQFNFSKADLNKIGIEEVKELPDADTE